MHVRFVCIGMRQALHGLKPTGAQRACTHVHTGIHVTARVRTM